MRSPHVWLLSVSTQHCGAVEPLGRSDPLQRRSPPKVGSTHLCNRVSSLVLHADCAVAWLREHEPVGIGLVVAGRL